MAIDIRSIAESDLPSVFDLMTEFAEYEKLSHLLKIDRDRCKAVMFGRDAFVSGLIASLDGEPVGYAIFYPCFSTFRSMPGLFLEDLFVSQRARGNGIGKLLLAEIARIARSRGFERIDLNVLEWNASAIGFYEALGGVPDPDDRHFKFSDQAFEALLK